MAADGKGDPVSEEPHDSNRTRMTVAEAARVLHISEGAVRKRVQRGTLEHERTPGGHLVVYLDSAATSETGRECARDGSHEDRSERYLRGLEDRVEDLRNELDREREADRENKRINATLEERIAELEAPQTARVVLAGLAGGLTLLSIASLVLHWWLFRPGSDRTRGRSSLSRTEAPANLQEK